LNTFHLLNQVFAMSVYCAFSKKCILITVDKDFGELTFRSKRPSNGIILYRLSGFSNIQKSQVIEGILRKRKKELVGSFTVIGKRQIRIRKLIF
jgi:predicted nuclease of predicted toxin-antitoxin system